MRVITGKYGGRTLKTLKGDTTRPTTQRVKESLFSSIISTIGTFEGLRILDAFAGSGALGIEALSRGAAHVTFFELSRQAAATLSENLRLLLVSEDSYKIEVRDVLKSAPILHGKQFDLVFLDPPYALDPATTFAFLEDLKIAGALTQNALIYFEFDKKNKLAVLDTAARLKWATVSAKDFGDTAYVLLRKGD